MSWSLYTLPISRVVRSGDMWEWLVAASLTRDLPEPSQLAAAPPLRAADALRAFQTVGCHGTPWFRLADQTAGPGLHPCPDPGSCDPDADLDLGEVSLIRDDDAEDYRHPVALDDELDSICFRGPSQTAALRVVHSLAQAVGPMVVLDDASDRVIVVLPEHGFADLRSLWPWKSI